MDFSKFSDSDFEPKEWVNAALRAHKDAQTPLDSHASTLVMKLQLFIQEVNAALEETSGQVVQNLPRVVREVEAVRQEASLLKDQMSVVKEDIKRVERETSVSMERLVELHAIKSRMMESQNALQEADNWTTLSADVEEVFASQDIEQIAEKLAGMQQSLNVLHDVPDYKERKKLLETLKNRLEALLSPKVVSAFTSHSLEEAKWYVQVFSGIERSPQLHSYFTRCHKTTIVQLWNSLSSPSKPLLEFLPQFFDELLSKWHAEHSWCCQVFPSPLPTLAALLTQSLAALDPPLDRRLQADVQRSATPLQTLTQLRQVALRFIKGLERALSTTSPTDLAPLFLVVEAVHTPYGPQLAQYPAMETQRLLRCLEKVDMTAVATEATVSLISDSVPKLFRFMSEAIEQCLHLTEGWGFSGIVKATESLFAAYLSKVSTTVRALREGCGLEGGGGGRAGEGEHVEEWAHLQCAFRIIQCCGELLLRTRALNTQLCSAVTTVTPLLRSPASEAAPFGCFDYLAIFHPEERTAALELTVAVEKGGGECSLMSSTTNQIHSLNEQAHVFAFDILFARLREKLFAVPHLRVWETGVQSPTEGSRALLDGLPSFSLSPLPYITEIGDYLLTLPQQLEPFTSQDSPALVAALRHGKLPYPETEVTESEEGEEVEGEGHPSDDWLGAVARGTMDTYVQSILRLDPVTPQAAQQLATDIGYLCNVLAALGQSPSQVLSQLQSLLKTPTEDEFLLLKEDKTISKQLFIAVAKLRVWQD